MSPIRTLTALAFLTASVPAFADDFDTEAQLYLPHANIFVAQDITAKERLKNVVEAHDDMEWHEGAEGESDSMVMVSDVLFDFGNASLNPEALAVLNSVAKEFKGIKSLEIEGHTDSVGSAERNLQLAQARADAVRAWLIANGPMSPDAITSVSKGETEPVAANALATGEDDPEGRSRNRRVEFHFVDAEPEETPVQVSQLWSDFGAI